MHTHTRTSHRFAHLPSLTALAVVAALAITVQAQAQKLITFDAPNAGAAANQGTSVTGINYAGTITGNVVDSGNGTHGYVRTITGGFTEFDAPGANLVVGGTYPSAINDLGVVTGEEYDSNGAGHAFVRLPDGVTTVFDAPGADTSPGSYAGTAPQSMNDLGVVAGYFWDSNSTAHGFVRTPDGRITTFDDPAAGNGVYQGTYPYSINDFGVIVGATTYADNSSHGLLRTPNGSFPDFQFPSTTYFNTAYINDLGVIAGSYSRVYVDSEPFGFTGYLRTPDGKMTVYEVPGGGTTTAYPYEGTWVNAVNIEGTAVGYIQNDYVESDAFIHQADGATSVFGFPGQAEIPGDYIGSGAFAINDLGVVAGNWHDTNLAVHGWVRLPGHDN
jgi:hypothetical protein